jgi:hypothetical protein
MTQFIATDANDKGNPENDWAPSTIAANYNHLPANGLSLQ